MGENPKPPPQILSPSANPCRPLTAMKSPSGGLAGGEGLPNSLLTVAPLSCRRFLHRHPPIAITSTNPYWIRGGLLPFSAEDLSDDEADLSYLGLGSAGGVEKESEFLWSESLPDLLLNSSPVVFPFKPTTEEWEKVQKEVEDEMKEMEVFRLVEMIDDDVDSQI